MDRRSFLKSLFIGATALATTDIEKILNETEKLSDEEFVTYITVSYNLYVHNPAKCGYIDGIG